MSRFVLWFFLIVLIIFRFLTTRPVFKNGDRVRITTTVSGEPTISSGKQKFKLAGLKVTLVQFPEIHYGDKIIIEGTVSNGELTNPLLINVSEEKGLLINFRKKIIDFYKNSLTEPDASLVAGTVLGAKENLPPDFWNALKNTGTVHVLVASGMNVSFVTSFLLASLLLFLPRRRAIPLTLFGVILYTTLTGFDAPIVRATIMATLAFLAQETGRLVSGFKTLSLTALIMLAIQPNWVTDIGFILSFVATLSLMLFQKKIEKLLSFIPEFFREDLSTTLAAQIGVSPILFATFGQFNILSPIINALILWTIPLIMIIGTVAAAFGLVFEPLGRLILYLAYPLTRWFIFIVQSFG